MLVLYILLAALLLVLLISWICYRIVFYAKPTAPLGPEEYDIPNGEIYEPYREDMIQWMKEVRRLPSQDFTVTSFDGLKLHGKYYEFSPDAPIELMFHGYRGSAERDLCGGVQRCFAIGHSALIVDQRTSCLSEGRVISFGINEHKDCLTWVDFMVEHFGADVKIILTGISMGAATVLMAAGRALPENVAGVLADCGYTSAKAIICKCAKQMGLPPRLVYPFIKLGARVFGNFDPDAYSPVQAMAHCRLPVIFYHGDADDFVPCEMSWENYDACAGPKELVVIRNAGHGLCYIIDREKYLNTLCDFFTKNGVPASRVKSGT